MNHRGKRAHGYIQSARGALVDEDYGRCGDLLEMGVDAVKDVEDERDALARMLDESIDREKAAEARIEALRASAGEAIRYLEAARGLTSDEPKDLIDDALATLAHFLHPDAEAAK